MSGKIRATSAEGVEASAGGDVAPRAFDRAELAKRPIAYPKERIYAYFTTHEAALLAVTVAGVVAGVLLLVWFLGFSGMNEPVQFIYDSF